jgi:hypothetical protein
MPAYMSRASRRKFFLTLSPGGQCRRCVPASGSVLDHAPPVPQVQVPAGGQLQTGERNHDLIAGQRSARDS